MSETIVIEEKPGLVARARQRVASIASGDTENARTQRDALVAFLVRAASAGLIYLTQIVLARWMGAHEYGIYVFVWTMVMVLGGITHLGLSIAVMRLLPAYFEKGATDLYRGLVRGARWFAFINGVVVAGLAWLAITWYGARFSSPYVGPALLILAAIPFYAVTDVQDGIGRARGWMAVGLVPPYIVRPLVLLGAATVAHYAGFPDTAITAAAAAIFGTVVALALQTWFVQKRIGAEVGAGPRAYELRGWITSSLPLLAMYVAELVMQNADVLIVSAYLTPEDVGRYFAAAKTMALVLFIHYAVGSAAAKRYSALNARSAGPELEAFVKQAVQWTFWPSLVTAVAILALGKPLLWMFSPKFVDAYPLMFVLAIGYLFRAAMGPAEFLLHTVGEQKRCAAVLAFAAAVNVALGFLLVPLFGVIGAATSTATAMAIAAVLNGVVARRRLGIELSIIEALKKR
ncbi:MAG TPA: lipopolysaccharide biosynthesis protein [Hyphomicrobiaceae bacterium]|nr:lipopolysaccharide biosynthesis protein [Hyphomicrobiaceae bacterium]